MLPRYRRDAVEMPPRCRVGAVGRAAARAAMTRAHARGGVGWLQDGAVGGQVWGTRAVVLPHMDMWGGAWSGNVSSCMCGGYNAVYALYNCSTVIAA